MGEEIERHKIKGVCHVAFRDKSLGWRKYSLRVDGDKGAWMESRYRNPYLKAFLCNLILRPSCHACPAKDFKSQSDITIADFWAVDKFLPGVNDEKGCNLVFVHDPKIEISFFKQQMNVFTLDVHAVCEENAVIHRSAKEHKNRAVFFEKLGEKNDIRLLLEKYATAKPFRHGKRSEALSKNGDSAEKNLRGDSFWTCKKSESTVYIEHAKGICFAVFQLLLYNMTTMKNVKKSKGFRYTQNIIIQFIYKLLSPYSQK